VHTLIRICGRHNGNRQRRCDVIAVIHWFGNFSYRYKTQNERNGYEKSFYILKNPPQPLSCGGFLYFQHKYTLKQGKMPTERSKMPKKRVKGSTEHIKASFKRRKTSMERSKASFKAFFIRATGWGGSKDLPDLKRRRETRSKTFPPLFLFYTKTKVLAPKKNF
jgi:hypothetical protein